MQQALVVFLFELRKTPRVTLGRVFRTGFLRLAEKCFKVQVLYPFLLARSLALLPAPVPDVLADGGDALVIRLTSPVPS